MPSRPETLGETFIHHEEEDYFRWSHVSGSLPGGAMPNI